MRKSAAIFALVVAAGLAEAAPPPPESTVARLTAVDVASRQVVADGMTWAMSSTVRVKVPGQKGGSLRDLRPGMHVRMVLAPSAGEVPVVNHITVLPD